MSSSRELVDALMDHMVTVEILDEHDDVQAQRKDDGVDLKVAAEVSLHRPVSGRRIGG